MGLPFAGGLEPTAPTVTQAEVLAEEIRQTRLVEGTVTRKALGVLEREGLEGHRESGRGARGALKRSRPDPSLSRRADRNLDSQNAQAIINLFGELNSAA